MGTPASEPWPFGRRFVVTGATSGIGLEIARGLVRARAEVVVVGRNATRCAEVVQMLGHEVPGGRASYVVADLSLLSSTRQLAQELLERYSEIHGLINNAGGVFTPRAETSEGIEHTFALNVIAPFLLTALLLDRLKRDAPARVVNVASAAHRGVSLDFDDLEAKQNYSGFGVYSRSKLALLYLTYEFARRLEGSQVAVNAVHPGFVRSGFGQNNAGGMAWGIRLAGIFAISVLRGARTPLYVATAPQLEGVSGRYFSGLRQVSSSPQSMDPDAGRRLWEYCERRTRPDAPSTVPPASAPRGLAPA